MKNFLSKPFSSQVFHVLMAAIAIFYGYLVMSRSASIIEAVNVCVLVVSVRYFGWHSGWLAAKEDQRKVDKEEGTYKDTMQAVAEYLNINEAEEKARPGYDGSGNPSELIINAINRQFTRKE